MNGSDIILQSLIDHNIEVIFGYPGGAAMPLYDRIPYYPKLKHILVRHEQGSSLAADGYFRSSGKIAVCLSTSGPGATNLITGVANAYMDSVPMIVLTCQVASPLIGTDAFQETDILSMTRPITKKNYAVSDIEKLSEIIDEAFFIANEGRKGPVHIDVPKDILFQKYQGTYTAHYSHDKQDFFDISEQDLKKCKELISQAKNPVIISGHGVTLSHAEDELKDFVQKTNIPMTSTLLGLGTLSYNHKNFLGMLGMHGLCSANMAVKHADLIIALGSRFDDRITGDTQVFGKGSKIIHIDIDKKEIGKNVSTDLGIVCDVKHALKELNKQTYERDFSSWHEKITTWKKEPVSNLKHSKDISIIKIIKSINICSSPEMILVSDVGQHQMFLSQHFECQYSEQFLCSGGLGTMGYSLPAAIGAQVACPKKKIWACMGDGSFQMNMQELGVILEYDLPIKIVMFNNRFLGMVRQWQELFFEKNYVSTPLINPDFQKIMEGYGIESYKIEKEDEVEKYISYADQSKKPIFLEFITAQEENVFPMVPSGKCLDEMIEV